MTLRRIEYSAFKDCKNLKNIEFPDALEYIGRHSFLETGLENVEFPASLRTVAQEAFARCKSLKTAMFREGLEVLGTDEYKDDERPLYGVFEESALESIKLPSTLRRMEYSAF